MGPLLVTGGTGLLGSAIRRIRPDAVFLSRMDGDLRERSVAHRLFEQIRPAEVLHLAGLVGGVKANATHNSQFLEDNALLNTAVLTAARSIRVPKLVAMLSSCAFPFFPDRATTETDLQSGLPYGGNAGYGSAKRLLDLHVRMAAREEGLRWTTLTPVTMYGPYDSFDPERGHVIGSLIRRCWEAHTQSAPYVVWGSGQAVRQFVFVDDMARLALDAVAADLSSETTIVAPDVGVTIRELAETIAEVMGYGGPIVFDRTQPEGVLVKRLRSESFLRQFPGYSFTSLQAGIEATVRWFRTQRLAEEPVSHDETSLFSHS
ncbi:MAG: NAD-dependent epimerase/dehydratase family protein [Nitrospira sp.]